MPLKPIQRDELLIRLDEKTANIWRTVEKQEKHLGKINDSVQQNCEDIISNRTNIRSLWKVIGGFLTLLAIAIPIILKIAGVY